MNRRARKALLESIEKWRQVSAGKMADMASDNCSLCMEYIEKHCCGCPVYEATGSRACDKTPYRKWVSEQSAGWVVELPPLVANTPKLIRLAKAEQKFLESLL